DGQTVKHGYYRAFYHNGSPKEAGEYAHGRKEGEWVYRQDGIKRVGTFADDRLVGLYKYYDNSGRKIREGP
ncbi:MAG: toxin-antitoxin system YwqK family antitoxin, partial [Candidatus Latescibacteria bacterium]|nr:toxin-antitoxin system YwqK family antitoxin [Candidatus Latescibacterota bacterium]